MAPAIPINATSPAADLIWYLQRLGRVGGQECKRDEDGKADEQIGRTNQIEFFIPKYCFVGCFDRYSNLRSSN